MNNKNQNRKIYNFGSFWPIILIAVLSAIVGGLIVWISYNTSLDEQIASMLPGQQKTLKGKGAMPLEVCTQDSDCVIVDSTRFCCQSKRAINKQYVDSYSQHPEWDLMSAEEAKKCSLIECDKSDRNLNDAQCISHICTLINR